ncbi:MAG: GGDEF domain-containing protein [Gammaproteobacteria bacterium]
MPITKLNSNLVYASSIFFWLIFTCAVGYLQIVYTFNIQDLKFYYFLAPGTVGIIFGVLTARIILLSHKLKQMAIRDPLTQSFNHGYYNQTLNDWCDKKATFSLILIDVDHFKNVNDEHGHMVGDQVLMRLCELVTETKRLSDVFARHGGEEFVLLVPRTDLVAASEIAIRLCEIIDKASMPYDIHLSCSLGVAQYRPFSDTPVTLFERADKALYASKSNGRNRVTLEEIVST